MNTQQTKMMGHSESTPQREIHSNAASPKSDRNNSSRQPNPTSIRTGGIATNKIYREQKEGNNQDQSRIKQHRD